MEFFEHRWADAGASSLSATHYWMVIEARMQHVIFTFSLNYICVMNTVHLSFPC